MERKGKGNRGNGGVVDWLVGMGERARTENVDGREWDEMVGDTGCLGESGRRGMKRLQSGRTSSLCGESYWTLTCLMMLSSYSRQAALCGKDCGMALHKQ